MDGLIRRIEGKSASNDTKQVAVFSSPMKVYQGADAFDLGEAVVTTMRVIGRFAARRPDVRVVVKMKDLHVKRGYLPIYENAVEIGAGRKLDNVVFVTDRMAAHDVIMASKVIVAMQSTVVLESAAAGKPVVLPHFEALRTQAGAERNLMFLHEHSLFDVPATEKDLEEILERRLRDNSIPFEIMEARRRLFKEYISPLDALATENAVKFLNKWAQIGRVRRRRRENGLLGDATTNHRALSEELA